MYEGERDYIDAAIIGNFARFINHQDYPSVEAQPIFVKSSDLKKEGVIDDTIFQEIPEWIELMGLWTLTDIAIGEELYIDYGERYWNGKDYSKIHAPNVPTLLKVVESLEGKLVDMTTRFDVLENNVHNMQRKMRGGGR